MLESSKEERINSGLPRKLKAVASVLCQPSTIDPRNVEQPMMLREIYTPILDECTPSQLDKARLTAGQIGIMSLDGKNHTPELKPTMETGMHFPNF